MNKTNTGSAIIVGLALVLGLGVLGYQLADAAIRFKTLERTVTVKGLSEREVPANVAAWPVRFQLAGNDLDGLFADIDTKTATVTQFLTGHGLADADITVSPPAITDLFAQQWGDKQHIKFRYTGNAAVTVYSSDIDAVRAARANLLSLGKQGVLIDNSNMHMDSNIFSFTALSDIKPAMIEEATKNARAVAEKFAQDSNSRLGKIRAAHQGQFSITDRDSTTPHIKKVRVVTTVEYYLSD